MTRLLCLAVRERERDANRVNDWQGVRPWQQAIQRKQNHLDSTAAKKFSVNLIVFVVFVCSDCAEKERFVHGVSKSALGWRVLNCQKAYERNTRTRKCSMARIGSTRFEVFKTVENGVDRKWRRQILWFGSSSHRSGTTVGEIQNGSSCLPNVAEILMESAEIPTGGTLFWREIRIAVHRGCGGVCGVEGKCGVVEVRGGGGLCIIS